MLIHMAQQAMMAHFMIRENEGVSLRNASFSL